MKTTLGPVEVAHEHRAAQSKWDWGDGGNAQLSLAWVWALSWVQAVIRLEYLG